MKKSILLFIIFNFALGLALAQQKTVTLTTLIAQPIAAYQTLKADYFFFQPLVSPPCTKAGAIYYDSTQASVMACNSALSFSPLAEAIWKKKSGNTNLIHLYNLNNPELKKVGIGTI